MSNDASSDLFKSVVEYGRDVLKAALIINGGASVALLAFIGNIMESKCSNEILNILTYALLSFCVGVLCAGSSCLFSYKSHHFALLHREDKDALNRISDSARRVKLNDSASSNAKNYREFHKWVSRSLVASFFFFTVGIILSVCAI